MGVYVFGSKHAGFIKVGHYVGDDPWGRVIRRGFNSCVSPRELRDLRSAQDLELLGWFPRLRRKHEGRVHRRFSDPRTSVGEWHSADKKDAILEMLVEEERRDIEENGDHHERKEKGRRGGDGRQGGKMKKKAQQGLRPERFPHFLFSDQAEYAFIDDDTEGEAGE